MKYEFTADFHTGIASVDAEHARLFEIANDAYDVLADEFTPDKYDRIADILAELREYTKTHFTHEEEYMASIQYKNIWSQKIQHGEFIAKLEAMDLSKIDEHQKESLLEIVDFLAKWLFNHIKGMDCKIPQT